MAPNLQEIRLVSLGNDEPLRVTVPFPSMESDVGDKFEIDGH